MCDRRSAGQQSITFTAHEHLPVLRFYSPRLDCAALFVDSGLLYQSHYFCTHRPDRLLAVPLRRRNMAGKMVRTDTPDHPLDGCRGVRRELDNGTLISSLNEPGEPNSPCTPTV